MPLSDRARSNLDRLTGIKTAALSRLEEVSAKKPTKSPKPKVDHFETCLRDNGFEKTGEEGTRNVWTNPSLPGHIVHHQPDRPGKKGWAYHFHANGSQAMLLNPRSLNEHLNEHQIDVQSSVIDEDMATEGEVSFLRGEPCPEVCEATVISISDQLSFIEGYSRALAVSEGLTK